VKGLRLTKRGEFVRDALFVAVVTAGFFPAMTIIISFFHTLGVQ
jgi:hypothetical protein